MKKNIGGISGEGRNWGKEGLNKRSATWVSPARTSLFSIPPPPCRNGTFGYIKAAYTQPNVKIGISCEHKLRGHGTVANDRRGGAHIAHNLTYMTYRKHLLGVFSKGMVDWSESVGPSIYVIL